MSTATGTVRWKDVPTRTVETVAARELEDGPERDQCWTLADAVYPGFDSYQQFTERRIPVAVLERRAADS